MFDVKRSNKYVNHVDNTPRKQLSIDPPCLYVSLLLRLSVSVVCVRAAHARTLDIARRQLTLTF